LITDPRCTSGRLRRPLVVLLAAAGVATLAWTGGARASSTAPAVKTSQVLVTLLDAHVARSGPSPQAAQLALVSATTPITGEQTTLPVLAREGEWLKVMLPGRPNGHTGWISLDATALATTGWHIVVDTSRRNVTIYLHGRPVQVFEAVVGKPSTPTPLGEFFVEESIALRPSDVGAPFALALSARSDVLQEFDGGPGQIALHGLANIGGIPGSAASHGCVRLTSYAMKWLVARIGPGVPVTIEKS